MELDRRRLLVGAAGVGLLGGVTVLARKPPAAPRRVVARTTGAAHVDGAGVKLRKLLGTPELRMLDPFLMLDAFGSDDPRDYLAGFPDHPHRGFETVTILLDGVVEHADSVGNHGRLTPNGIQWMTAGRGIVHREMPEPLDGKMRGFQLWVNLPAKHKWDAPRYQDLKATDVPTVDQGDARVRVLAGRVGGALGPVDGVVVRPTLLDVTVPAGGTFHTELPGGHAAFLHGIDGELLVGPDATPVPAGTFAVLSEGTSVQATGAGRFLLVAGAPIGEPVARRGPFVMNTDEEIRQAYEDYRSGRLVGG